MIRLIHGIRQYKAEAHMEPLADALADMGLESRHITYGPVLVPVTNARAVNAIMDECNDGDDLVGFSNGCWAIHQALELGLKPRNVFLISPALNKAAEFPGVESVTVYHSKGDWPTWLSKWHRKATGLLPWRWRAPHGWGEMGRTGYTGESDNVTNYDMGSATGHEWYNHPNIVRMIANDVANAR